MQVGPGARVTIHGLKGKPELNGQSAVLVGQAAGGRVAVKLDSGQEISLKQENIGIEAPGGGGGDSGGDGGMPGAGGMPSMPGSVGEKLEQAAASLKEVMADLEIHLPEGVSMMQFGGMLVAALFMLNRFFTVFELWLSSGAAIWGVRTGMIAFASAKASAALRRPFPKWASLCVLFIVAALLIHRFVPQPATSSKKSSSKSGGSTSDSLQDTACAQSIREAYDQGYDDGAAGSARRPPKHIPMHGYNDDAKSSDSDDAKSSRGTSSSDTPSPEDSDDAKSPDDGDDAESPDDSGHAESPDDSGHAKASSDKPAPKEDPFQKTMKAKGSYMRYGLILYQGYKLGKGPQGWSPQQLWTSARGNPLGVVFMLVLASGMII